MHYLFPVVEYIGDGPHTLAYTNSRGGCTRVEDKEEKSCLLFDM
jgi:hypothetical protein